MGCEVRWTASARRDVDAIIRHIAVSLDSPKAAGEHLDAILDAAAVLSEFPEVKAVGSHTSLARRGLRPYFVKRYVILYAYEDGAVTVHRVFHTLRDYARLIGE